MSKTINLGPVSAYALAKKHGFVGTEAEWLKSLGAHIGENGNWWVGDNDLGVLADPAELSKLTQQAQTAKSAAEDAAGAAGRSAEAAQRSASNAGNAANVAAAGASAAKTAQEAAAKSASAAAESATAAQTSAETAIKSAANAADSATAAQNAQTQARDSAVSASKDAAATAEARKIVEGAADAETLRVAAENLRVEAEKARAAKDAERDGKINAIADGLGALRARENVLTGSAPGTVVSVEDAAAAPLCGLHIYGKSTQDGTPTPDAPVPIVSTGDGGSVAVKVTGKNLFPVITNANISKINKPTGGVRYGYVFYVPAQSSVIASGNADIGTNCFVGNFDTKTQAYTQKAQLASEKGGTYTAKLQSGWYVIYIANDHLPTILIKLNAAKIQLEIGTKATVYEPYREQLLTLPTPNGLPGIPVASGGNYTDQNGQQWVCDELDFERGVKAQRVDKSAFDSTKTLAEQNAILATPIETPLTSAEIAAYKAITAYAPNTVVQADGAHIALDYQRDVNIVIKNLENAIASITTQ